MISFFKTRPRSTTAAMMLVLIVPTSLVLSASSISPPQPVIQQAPSGDKSALAPAQLPSPMVKTVPAAVPIRSVQLVRSKTQVWPDKIEASGDILPWHESQISAEVGGLRLASVQVKLGDTVNKGQVLARLDTATVETDLDVSNAHLAEAEAVRTQAVATLERANRLVPSGGISQQERTLYETQKRTAEARVDAARAQVKRQQLRLAFATIVAPDDGVISSCSASEGAFVQAGSELFRLIRQGRLEWRAEVGGETLLKLSAGQDVTVKSPIGSEVTGRIRQVSPTINVTTRNGLVYVDLPQGTNLKAGLHVSGAISMGKRKALVLPLSAVLRKDGKDQVFKVDAESRIEAIDVTTGRVKDGWIEIVTGLDERAEVVAKDLSQLKVGDLVKEQNKVAENKQILKRTAN
jgi:HlyD family secretion protein